MRSCWLPGWLSHPRFAVPASIVVGAYWNWIYFTSPSGRANAYPFSELGDRLSLPKELSFGHTRSRMSERKRPSGIAPSTREENRPMAGALLFERLALLVERWRASRYPTPYPEPSGKLTRREIEAAGAALLALQRGLTGDRGLAGRAYMDDRELLGAYLLYYWPVSYMQVSVSLAERPFSPRRVLDLGSGPGPASAAAIDASRSGLRRFESRRTRSRRLFGQGSRSGRIDLSPAARRRPGRLETRRYSTSNRGPSFPKDLSTSSSRRTASTSFGGAMPAPRGGGATSSAAPPSASRPAAASFSWSRPSSHLPRPHRPPRRARRRAAGACSGPAPALTPARPSPRARSAAAMPTRPGPLPKASRPSRGRPASTGARSSSPISSSRRTRGRRGPGPRPSCAASCPSRCSTRRAACATFSAAKADSRPSPLGRTTRRPRPRAS